MTMQTVAFDIECVDLPDHRQREYDALRLGIQEKKEMRQDVACSVRQARFMFTLGVSLKEGFPIFRGSQAQGAPGDQFIYLVWGERDGEVWATSRRVKIPLSNIDPQRIEQAVSANLPLAMRVVMTNNKGEPIVGTLKSDQYEWL